MVAYLQYLFENIWGKRPGTNHSLSISSVPDTQTWLVLHVTTYVNYRVILQLSVYRWVSKVSKERSRQLEMITAEALILEILQWRRYRTGEERLVCTASTRS